MSLEKRNAFNELLLENECKLCGTAGRIIIYRSDLEEFEEVKCYLCLKKV
ncbi:MAG: hypothetical protein ACFE91_10015 [Promethearchaeota archaeon]